MHVSVNSPHTNYFNAVPECGELHRAAGGALQQLCKFVNLSGSLKVLLTLLYFCPLLLVVPICIILEVLFNASRILVIITCFLF